MKNIYYLGLLLCLSPFLKAQFELSVFSNDTFHEPQELPYLDYELKAEGVPNFDNGKSAYVHIKIPDAASKGDFMILLNYALIDTLRLYHQ